MHLADSESTRDMTLETTLSRVSPMLTVLTGRDDGKRERETQEEEEWVSWL